MPLLRRKTFQKASLPKGLRKQDEVFYCSMTNEIFRDYEEFCQRVILCNSMVWSCSLTGKSGLTYIEAQESEENAKQTLNFPTELQIPILFLGSKTHRTSFTEMFEDVFTYIRDRYFIGENVITSFAHNKWEPSRILQVIAPKEQMKNNNKSRVSDGRQFYPPATSYRYQVEQVNSEDEDIAEVMIVTTNQIKRSNHCNRDKYKMFLKQHVEQNDRGMFVVKESVIKDYGIDRMKFEKIFDGPMPVFPASKRIIKNVINGKKSKQETITQFLKKNNGLDSTENTVDLLEKMRKKEEEYHQLMVNLKQKKADEKLAEKQKQREENVKITMMLKEWYKPKEDLELEDHEKIPVPEPLKLKIPEKYVGDVLVILEFVHSFSKLLHARDFFPGGLTLDLMERALLQNELAGPLVDIVQMLLAALFNLQNEEASQCAIKIDYSTDLKIRDINDNVSLSEATYLATKASNWSIIHQGVTIQNLPLYALTTTEILRLHLLSSGARVNESGAKWRYQHRGGYTSEDDPALYLRLKYPHVLKALALYNITELPIGDKLKIIDCLINQILTFADIRDEIEDRLEKSKQAKLDLRNLQITERRQDHEYITAKFKIKKEGKENKKDVTADLDKLSKDAEKKKGIIDKKMKSLTSLATKYQNLLGQDRAFRKYLKLESIPGLLVNFEEDNPGICFDECVEQIPELVGADRSTILSHIHKIYQEMNLNNKENLKNNESIKVNGMQSTLDSIETDSVLLCNADSLKCQIHSDTINKQKWSFYHNKEQIEELTRSLNKRGIRESELQQTLINEQARLNLFVSQTPTYQLNCDIPPPEIDWNLRPKQQKTKYKHTLETNSASALQLTLVDNILEMEEKIYAGNLGCIKIKDRSAWREHMMNRQYEKFDKTLKHSKITNNEEDSRPITPNNKEYKDPGTLLGTTFETESRNSDTNFDASSLLQLDEHKIAIETLAIALAQIGEGVESRYLKKPLGHAFMKSDPKNAKYDVFDKWEQSLLAATSYSQIFLHYSMLDNCILWARSALLARCQICRRQNDSENMLLCDFCNKGHHLYCLKPKLTTVPIGEWFCKECQKQKDKEEKLNNPEPKPTRKRRIFKEELSDDSSEESEGNGLELTDADEEEAITESDEVQSDSENQKGDSSNFEICSKCSVGGTLLCCDNCPELYHLECTEPPLRRVPRGEWFCHKCRIKKKRENSESDSLEFMSSRRSNRREAENRDDLPLHNASLQELLSDVLKQEYAWPFLRPVQKFEVPDYYDIITKPMDFGTIKYKLNMGEYKCDADLMVDAALVFENCNTYNNSEDEVYQCGVKLLNYFSSKCRNLGLKLPDEFCKKQNNSTPYSPAPKKMRTD